MFGFACLIILIVRVVLVLFAYVAVFWGYLFGLSCFCVDSVCSCLVLFDLRLIDVVYCVNNLCLDVWW